MEVFTNAILPIISAISDIRDEVKKNGSTLDPEIPFIISARHVVDMMISLDVAEFKLEYTNPKVNVLESYKVTAEIGSPNLVIDVLV